MIEYRRDLTIDINKMTSDYEVY